MPPGDDRRRRVGRTVRRFFALPLRDQAVAAQAAVLLGISALLLGLLSYPRLERLLGTRFAESPDVVADGHVRQAERIGRLVRSTSARVPWRSDCLPQAMTAKLLLRRRGIDSTLYVGAAFLDTKPGQPVPRELRAHAWLRCGSVYVTGGAGRRRFGAVVSFS